MERGAYQEVKWGNEESPGRVWVYCFDVLGSSSVAVWYL